MIGFGEGPRRLLRATGSGCPNAGRVASSSAASPPVKIAESGDPLATLDAASATALSIAHRINGIGMPTLSPLTPLVMRLNRFLFFGLNAHFSSNSTAETCIFVSLVKDEIFLLSPFNSWFLIFNLDESLRL